MSKRSEILDGAMVLFREQGYKNTSVQQIADHCGISKGGVYLHFQSKTDLATSITGRLAEQIKDGVAEIRKRTDLSPRERMVEQIRYQLTDVVENQTLMEACLKDSDLALNEELMFLAQKQRYASSCCSFEHLAVIWSLEWRHKSRS